MIKEYRNAIITGASRGVGVNIASLVAKIPFPYDVAYATSKAGLAHFTASLRAEYRGTGVSASKLWQEHSRIPGYPHKP